MRMCCDGRVPMRPPRPPPSPKILTFFSWWHEEGKKRYMEMHYDMDKAVFNVVLDKTISLKWARVLGVRQLGVGR